MNTWQAVAVLHVSAPNVDADELLRALSLPGAVVWRKGDTAPRRRPYTEDGLRATLVDADSMAALHRGLLRHLASHTALHSELAKNGGSSLIDLGLMVPPTHPLSLTFEPELLKGLLDAGIVLTVTAYPCSEEGAGQQEDEADEARDG